MDVKEREIEKREEKKTSDPNYMHKLLGTLQDTSAAGANDDDGAPLLPS